ncbi:uncharacterized protein LOC135818207 [Sycon ciliatum]|uniref:uncharacterized protein LOC135818207 n=1 Tax=Sycon ciliatum TaxID=27933 RepID=UPI0020AE4816|eukprot:scpid72829/ scgid30558/ 
MDNSTAGDFNSTITAARIDSDWELSTVEWVVFIACLCSVLLLAMFIALVGRYRNQRDDDDDWREVPVARRASKKASTSSAGGVRTIVGGSTSSQPQAVIAESPNPHIGSQSSISPIVVPHEHARAVPAVRPGAASLSSSVPAINVTTPPATAYHLTADQARRERNRPSLPWESNSNRTSSGDRAPTPIIWGDQQPPPVVSEQRDPVYGYSHLHGAGNPNAAQQRAAMPATAEVNGEYDDVLAAQARSHRVTTPRQSHHYDNVAA